MEDSAPQTTIETSVGPIRAIDVGTGEPLVFVHGVLANGLLWREVVALMRGRRRCIVPDWPLGSHSVAVAPHADLTPGGLANLIVEVLDALGLGAVTLVGNDTGGALCQIVAAEHPDRVSRLVLTPCDAYENFPPRSIFWPLDLGARVPGGLKAVLQLLRIRVVQRLPTSFSGLSRRLGKDVIAQWLQPGLRDKAIRHDLRKVIRGIDRRYTLDAAEKLRTFDHPVLIAWAPEARFFPIKYGERLAADLSNATLERIDDAYTFVSVDQPGRTAQLIEDFLDANPVTGLGS